MEISRIEYARSLKEAAYLGAKQALIEAGLIGVSISRTEANERYGCRTVQRWINEGTVNIYQDGHAQNSTIRISVVELIAASLSSNRRTFNRGED